MNVNRFARSVMAKSYDGESFLLHVAEVMERQLKEWDAAYEVVVMKLIDYEVVIKKENRSYELLLTEKDLLLLQQTSPYALDRYLWQAFEKQGLPIVRGNGDYIESMI
ncbi:hypothetical protein [Guptibacillus sedimenti]|uniref:hypothetical protein n=1 Tax=Guptibacillus sedimenti TaxID=3025680 RepID=UPI00235F6152|nr:hypothetical protein [Pseudalkalibacillus sedimenti]